MVHRGLVVALALASLGSAFAARSSRADSIRSYQSIDSYQSIAASPAMFDPSKLSEFPAENLFGGFDQRDSALEDRRRDDRLPFFPVGEHEARRYWRFAHEDKPQGNPPAAVPEPNSLLLASFGLAGILLLRKGGFRRPPSPPGAAS